MHITPYKDGYIVQVRHKQYRASKSFPNKGMAQTWAAEQLKEFKRLAMVGHDDRHPVAALFERYYENVSPTKKGGRWEIIRLRSLSKHRLFAKKKISQITPELLGEFRDERLAEVSSGTVLRELGLLSSIFETAIKEWRMMDKNPVKMIRKPKSPKSRDRLISPEEAKAFYKEAGWDEKSKPTTKSQTVAAALAFSLATGMRCGEVCGLENKNISEWVAKIFNTKNGEDREVPLSGEAKRILALMPKEGKPFDIKPSQVDALFRKIRGRIKGANYCYHDSRRAYITTMAKKVDVLTLARIVGHSDIKQLQVYYKPSMESIAKTL